MKPERESKNIMIELMKFVQEFLKQNVKDYIKYSMKWGILTERIKLYKNFLKDYAQYLTTNLYIRG